MEHSQAFKIHSATLETIKVMTIGSYPEFPRYLWRGGGWVNGHLVTTSAEWQLINSWERSYLNLLQSMYIYWNPNQLSKYICQFQSIWEEEVQKLGPW